MGIGRTAHAQQTITVTNTGDNGAGSLRQAIADATSGDTIDLTGLTGAIELTSGALFIDKPLTIIGPGATVLAVSGGHASRVFRIAPGVVARLESLAIQNGNGRDDDGAPGPGGGILNDGTLTLRNVVVANNHTSADEGGGIQNFGTLTLVGSLVTNNTAWIDGGGIYSSGELRLNSSTLRNNSARHAGGGIFSVKLLIVENSTFIGNSAGWGGGGGIYSRQLYLSHSLLALNRAARGGAILSLQFSMVGTTIEHNAATETGHLFEPGEGADGGGILFISGATPIITGSTISNNSADRHGGGIAFESFGDMLLMNSTISGNSGGAVTSLTGGSASMALFNVTVTGNHSAANPGGGFQLYSGAQVYLSNSIVAGNAPGNFNTPDGVASHNSLVDVDVTTVLDTTLADNGGPTKTHALVPNSPAIDAADDSEIQGDFQDLDGDGDKTEALDQRGSPRLFGAHADIGAVEMSCSAIVLTRNAPSAAPNVGVPYAETIVASGGAGPYSFTAVGLPPGLTLSPSAVLSGTPTASGTFAVTVTVTDAFGCGGTLTFTFTIADPSCGIVIGPATLKTPYLATLYYQPLSVTPSGQYMVTVSAGALPQGVYLFAIGRSWFLGGIPAKSGEYTFTLAATKTNSPCAPTRTFTVIVPATVLPQLTCVAKTGGKQYTAQFGYDNSTDAAVTIPVGADNAFTPGAQNRGQVTTFQKGRVTNAFSVVFTVKNNNTDLALWYLRGPDNVRRPVNITTATSRCP